MPHLLLSARCWLLVLLLSSIYPASAAPLAARPLGLPIQQPCPGGLLGRGSSPPLARPTAAAPDTAVRRPPRPAPGTAEASGVLHPATVFPNPVVPYSTVDYDVPRTGEVILELLDSRGTTLRTLLREKQTKGPHTLQLPVHELLRGTYYLKINTRTGTETQRFVRN